MIILAIDPGSRESGWVIYDTVSKRLKRFESMENRNLLDILGTVNTIYQVQLLVIEMIASYGMPVGADIFETCTWIGRFEQAFGLARSKRVYRMDVKMHLCKNSRAKDSNVRQAIIDRYEPTGGGKTPQIGIKAKQGPLYGVTKDVWSALAIAITFAETKINKGT